MIKLKEKVKIKNTFNKLLIYYTLVLFFILSFSMGILYFGYTNRSIKENTKIEYKNLDKAENYMNTTLSWVRDYLYQCYVDADLNNLMFSRDEKLINGGYEKLMQIPKNTSNIYSAYVYNHGTEKIYSSNGLISSLNNFYDKECISYLRSNVDNTSIKIIPRVLKEGTEDNYKYKDVYTLILSNNMDEYGMPQGAIIINMDMDNMKKYLFTGIDSDEIILAIDTTGNIILDSSEINIGQEVFEYIKSDKMFKNNEEVGFLIKDVKDKKYLICYNYNKILNNYLVNLIPYNKVLSNSIYMLEVMMICFAVMLSIGVIVIFLLSKKIYSSIDNTLNIIKGHLNSNEHFEKYSIFDEKNQGDMEYISVIIDDMFKNYKNHQKEELKFEEKDMEFMRKFLIKSLLFNKGDEIRNYVDKMELLGINMDGEESALAITINIIGINDFDEVNEIHLEIKEKINNVGKDYYILNIDEQEICLLFLKLNIPEIEIIESMKSIQKVLNEKYSLQICISLGKCVLGIKNIYKSYRTAKENSQYRFKYGRDSIIYEENINKDIDQKIKYDLPSEIRMFDSLKEGNGQAVIDNINKVFESLYYMSYADMIFYITRLSNRTFSFLNEFNIEISKYNNDSREAIKAILKVDTCEEVKKLFLEIYYEFLNIMNEKKNTKKSKLIEKVKEYINDNYSNQLLSVEYISNEFKMSSNYLRTLFKDAEGKSISSFINEIRFEKAKELLEHTDLTAGEVSEKVGFTNTNYFYTSFKKMYGLSPTQFRNTLIVKK